MYEHPQNLNEIHGGSFLYNKKCETRKGVWKREKDSVCSQN